jgi:hypothetical protein
MNRALASNQRPCIFRIPIQKQQRHTRCYLARSELGPFVLFKPQSGSLQSGINIGVLQTVAPPPPRASLNAHTCPFGHGGSQPSAAVAAVEIEAAPATRAVSLRAVTGLRIKAETRRAMFVESFMFLLLCVRVTGNDATARVFPSNQPRRAVTLGRTGE